MLTKANFLTLFLSLLGSSASLKIESTPPAPFVGALNSIHFALKPQNIFVGDLAKAPELNLIVTYGEAGSSGYYANKPLYYLGYILGSLSLAYFGFSLYKDLKNPQLLSHATLIAIATWVALIEGENISLNANLIEGAYTPFMEYPNFTLQYASVGLLAGYGLFSKNPLVRKLMVCLVVTAGIMEVISSTFLTSVDKPSPEKALLYAAPGFILAGLINKKNPTLLNKIASGAVAAWTAAGLLANADTLLYSLTN